MAKFCCNVLIYIFRDHAKSLKALKQSFRTLYPCFLSSEVFQTWGWSYTCPGYWRCWVYWITCCLALAWRRQPSHNCGNVAEPKISCCVACIRFQNGGSFGQAFFMTVSSECHACPFYKFEEFLPHAVTCCFLFLLFQLLFHGGWPPFYKFQEFLPHAVTCCLLFLLFQLLFDGGWGPNMDV